MKTVTIRLDHHAHLDAVTGLHASADRLAQHQRTVSRDVETLLDGGWCGGAASSYREAWEQWEAGGADVVAALATMADLVAAARVDLVERDAGAALDLDRLAPTDADSGTW